MTPGRLFVVATPLGNREDLSPRAIRVLREADLIACEDTRHTGTLLRGHDIRTPLTSFFEHNERRKLTEVIAAIDAGKTVVLVSDAGTPGISDPGYRLIREARTRGISVVPVPGPSAVVAALSVSGLPTDRFLFVGFLPKKAGARREAIAELLHERGTLVFYESPLRVVSTLEALRETLGDREAFLCREATKLHEEYVLAPLSALSRILGERDAVKGEIVLVVAGAVASVEHRAEDSDDLFAELVASGKSRREAAKEIARRTGLPAREIYARSLARAEIAAGKDLGGVDPPRKP